MPVKHRTLAETLNPQPLAFSVIHDLLCWIDRCDEASQHGASRPAFSREDGSPIFPPESAGDDYYWWLTDVKRKADSSEAAAVDKGDEDGPLGSDVDEDECEDEGKMPAEAIVTDSDEASDPADDRELHSQPTTLVLPLARSAPQPKVSFCTESIRSSQ